MTAILLVLVSLVCAQEDAKIRIALGSCAHQDSAQVIWREVEEWDPDLFIHLGDAVYSDTNDPAVMAEAYARAEGEEHFASVRTRVPFLSTWDDHDYGENDGGAAYTMKTESERLFHAFWSTQADSERVSRPGVYVARSIEKASYTVQVIVLDTRSFRSDWAPGQGGIQRYRPDSDPEKTMLGAEQWSWLKEQLTIPADLRIVASSIQVVNNEHGWECWGNFPMERQRLFDLIQSSLADRVILVSGDRHFSELTVERSGVPYPLYDLTSSGLTQVARDGHRVPNSKRVGSAVSVQNFAGLVADLANDRLEFVVIDRTGDVRYRHHIDLKTLTRPREITD